MKKLTIILISCVLIVSLLSGCSNQSASNQDDQNDSDIKWPEKPITLTLGWAAGGGADLTSRAVFHPFVEDILGQKIIITYKEGSGGEISFVDLANAEPDGYNFAWTVTPHLVSFPISRETKYQLEDVKPVCNIAYDPGVFAVPADSEFNNLDDLVNYAKENPGKVTIGNGGTGGDDFIAVELFKKAADIDVTQVAYAEGTGAQISGLMGKHIAVAAFNASEATQYLESEGIKLLGVMSEERVDIIPDVPTFKEQGYDVIMSSDRGFSAPAGTPSEIINKMAKAVEDTLNNPEFIEKAEKLNLLIKFMGPEEYKEYLYEYRDNLQKIYDSNPW